MRLRRHETESINDVITRLRETSAPRKEKPPLKATDTQVVTTAKHVCCVLGESVFGESLPEVFGNVIDVMHDLDPEVLERLAKTRISYVRSIISRDKSKIHLRSQHLKTAKSKSGWWYSRSVSQDQVERMLKELCKVASLEYGVDIRWGNPHRN